MYNTMTNEKQVRENIDYVLKERRLNSHNLSNGVVSMQVKIFNQLYKGKTITFDVIAVLLNAVPDLNTEWLFRNVGSPFKDRRTQEERLLDIEERLACLEDVGKAEKNNASSQTA